WRVISHMSMKTQTEAVRRPSVRRRVVQPRESAEEGWTDRSLLWALLFMVSLLLCVQGVIYIKWLGNPPTVDVASRPAFTLPHSSVAERRSLKAPPTVPSPSSDVDPLGGILKREARCDLVELEKASKDWDGLSLSPLPSQQWWEGEGPARMVGGSELDITADIDDNAVLDAAFERLRWRLVAPCRNLVLVFSSSQAAKFVRHVHVQVEDRGTTKLAFGVNEAFELYCSEGKCLIMSRTVFGALRGLDTLWKLFIPGSAPWDSMSIVDEPEYQWRGLMLDMGRRFVPVSLALEIVDAMEASRLNVLHLHLNDFCRFAIEVPGFEDTLGEPVTALIEYARLRGIRVVPEVDMPGHANALGGLEGAGLQFCRSSANGRAEDATKLYDDQGGRTREVVGRLLAAVSAIFPDDHFHIGADETEPIGLCTVDNMIALEEFMLEQLQSLGKKPVAWEELIWKAGGKLDAAASKAPGTVIQVWNRHKASDVAEQTYHPVIVSSNSRVYLDHPQTPVEDYWWDITRSPEFRPSTSSNAFEVFGLTSRATPPAFEKLTCRLYIDGSSGIECPGRKGRWARRSTRTLSIIFRGDGGSFELATPDSGRTWIGDDVVLRREVSNALGRVLGGEAVMWTDNLLEQYQCGAASAAVAGKEDLLPRAPLMWPRAMDESLSHAMLGMIFPKAAVYGAVLWRFDPLLTAALRRPMIRRIVSSLRGLGVRSCDAEGGCDELHDSGGKMIQPFSGSTLDTCYKRHDGEYFPDFTKAGEVPYGSDEDAAVACYWAGSDCAGVTCEAGLRQCTLRANSYGVPSPTNEISFMKIASCMPRPTSEDPQKSPTITACYTSHAGKYIPNLTNGGGDEVPLAQAEELCREKPSCEGITCSSTYLCTLRAGPGVSSSPTGEISYVKRQPPPPECHFAESGSSVLY
ncbi:hypothetical protein FOZ62_031358, partial [Perkinsus olseni]